MHGDSFVLGQCETDRMSGEPLLLDTGQHGSYYVGCSEATRPADLHSHPAWHGRESEVISDAQRIWKWSILEKDFSIQGGELGEQAWPGPSEGGSRLYPSLVIRSVGPARTWNIYQLRPAPDWPPRVASSLGQTHLCSGANVRTPHPALEKWLGGVCKCVCACTCMCVVCVSQNSDPKVCIWLPRDRIASPGLFA